MNRLHIVGRKNSGKTTLICELVQALTRKGLKVATIKHTHHHHELDTPGKDSHQHRISGAAAVGILSPKMNAVFWPSPSDEMTAAEKEVGYARFESLMSDCDLILVEGDSSTEGLKVEVFRQEIHAETLAANDPTIRAVISDDDLEISTETWPRSNLPELLSKIQALVESAN